MTETNSLHHPSATAVNTVISATFGGIILCVALSSFAMTYLPSSDVYTAIALALVSVFVTIQLVPTLTAYWLGYSLDEILAAST